MNKYDVAGLLMTYSERARKAENTKHLRIIVKNLKELLDLRTIKMEGDTDGE